MINLLQQFYSRGSSPPPPVSPPPSTGSAFRQFNPCDPCCGAATSDPSTFCDITPPDDLVLINGDGKHILAYQGLDGDGNSYWRGLVTFNNAIAFSHSFYKVVGDRYTYDASAGNPSLCSSFGSNFSPLINGVTLFLGSSQIPAVFNDNVDYDSMSSGNTYPCLSQIPGSHCTTVATNYSMCLQHKVDFIPITIAPVYVQITRKPTVVYGVPTFYFEEKIKCQYDSDYEYIKTPTNNSAGFIGTLTPGIKTYNIASELCNVIYMDIYNVPFSMTVKFLGINTSNSAYYNNISDYVLNRYVCGECYDVRCGNLTPFNNNLYQITTDNCFWSRSFPIFTQIDSVNNPGSRCYSFLGWSNDSIGKDIFTYDPDLFFNYTGTPFSYTVQHPQYHVDNTIKESVSLLGQTNRQKYSQLSHIWGNGFFRVILPSNNKRTINPVRFINTRTRQLARNFNCQILGFNFELNCVNISTYYPLWDGTTKGHVAAYFGQPSNNCLGVLLINDYTGDYNFYFIQLNNGAAEYAKAGALFTRMLNKELGESFFGGGEGCTTLIGSCFNYSDYSSTVCDPNKSDDFKENIIHWDRKVYVKSGNLSISDVLNIDPLVIGFNAENHYKTIYGDITHTSDRTPISACGDSFIIDAYYNHYGSSIATEIYESESVIITELN